MHYVICYDLENDRLRDQVAKLLQRKSCGRVQRSVFVARDYDRKALGSLKTARRALLNRPDRHPADSLVLLPLRDSDIATIIVLGANNVHPALTPPALKIIL